MWALAAGAAVLWSVAVGLTLVNGFRQPRARLATLLRLVVLAITGLLVFLPTLVSSWREVQRPRLLVLVDASRSMALAQAQGRSRYDEALEWADALKKRFAPRFEVWIRPFGFSLKKGMPAKEAVEGGTDLGRTLKEALREGTDDRLRGMFLLSDGRQTEKGDPLLWARSSAVPIFVRPLGKGMTKEADFAISAFRAPEVAFRAGQVGLEVVPLARGYGKEAGQGLVELLVDGKVESQQTFDPLAPTTLRFPWTPRGEGFCKLTVRIPPRPDEMTDGNNQAETVVWVEKEPRRVLLLACRPMEELAFFRRALAQDPRFQLQVALSRDPSDPLRIPAGTRLADFGLVVLFGYDEKRLEPGLAERLRRWVASEDGALLVMGNGAASSHALFESPLASLLPVKGLRGDGQTALERRPFVLTASGQGHPLCTVLANPQMNEAAWRELPPLRPGAETTEATADAKVLAHYAALPKPHVAAAYRLFGRGILLWFNTDELWLWKLMLGASGDPDAFYESFARGLGAWMSDGLRGEGLSIHTDRTRYRVGDSVYVRLVGATRAEVLKVSSPDGKTRDLPLVSRAGSFEGRFVIETAGAWRIELARGTARPRDLVAIDTQRELVDPRPDAELLGRVATLSRGSVLADGPAALASLNLDDAPLTRVHRSRLFWLDEGRLLLLVLVLLCSEWILRRRVNLP